MTIAVVVAAVILVAAVVAIWLTARSRRSVSPPILRDAPAVGVEEDALGSGLAKTRRALGERIAVLFGREPGPGVWEELEEALLAADVGVAATAAVVRRVRERRPGDADAVRRVLADELVAGLGGKDRDLRLAGDPSVIVVVGVNGSGKTTTIAKLGARLESQGRPTLLGAADTFRAAASEQLGTWASRLQLDLVSGQRGADPASVAFDALQAARARGMSAVIIDTAGRLHSKQSLMDELGKVVRVLRREAGGISEVLLVLDGTTGQNGIAQARTFTEVVGVTGVVITKLDGTAKGGIAIAVEQELGIPVKYIGVGERPEDLLPFDAAEFVDALLRE